jgi:hypothetical protein
VRHEQPQPMIYVAVLFIVLETAHLFSPIALAWTTPGFRQMMLQRPAKFLALPAGALMAALVAPFSLVGWIYYWWNIQHFGAQHFGVMSLWRGRAWRYREFVFALCLVLTFLAMSVPRSSEFYLLAFVLVSVGHWVTDIGLSSYAARRWWFLVGMLALGALGFVWLAPNDHGVARRAIPWIVSARMGLGFVHFLYSRWVWRLIKCGAGQS